MCDIMIMDSNIIKRQVVSQVLTKEFNSVNYVHGVENIKNAENLLKNRNIDLMIIDIDGNSSVSSFINKAKKVNPDLATILTTVKSETEAIIANVRLNADDYLLKPYSPQEMINTVERYVFEIDKRIHDNQRNRVHIETIEKAKQEMESFMYKECRDSCIEYINLIYDSNSSTSIIIDKLCEFIKSLVTLFGEGDLLLPLNIATAIGEIRYEMDKYEDRVKSYELVFDVTRAFFIDYEKKHTYYDEIKKAVNYINLNITSEITLDRVADHVNVSKYYFSKLFKKKMNTNFISYVIDEKMEVAKTLLEYTDVPVSEIASKLSYDETNYFSKAFKKTVGITPSAYRKSAKY
ncbi:MAG: helix-turn-helix domain-containing protein [Peptostreptococcaceae bacterium]|nr:helix-turn-helix domain-containing protein [Peptostreptococcaceae bacterium]